MARRKNIDPIKERAKHHLDGFLETLRGRKKRDRFGLDGTFKSWVEARRLLETPRDKSWWTSYHAAFFRILEETATWEPGKAPSVNHLRALEQMSPINPFDRLNDALNEE